MQSDLNLCKARISGGMFSDTAAQDSVVQSIISLTSSLVVKMLTALVSTVSNSVIFAKKNVSSFCKCKSYSHVFSKNISIYAIFNDQF